MEITAVPDLGVNQTINREKILEAEPLSAKDLGQTIPTMIEMIIEGQIHDLNPVRNTFQIIHQDQITIPSDETEVQQSIAPVREDTDHDPDQANDQHQEIDQDHTQDQLEMETIEVRLIQFVAKIVTDMGIVPLIVIKKG